MLLEQGVFTLLEPEGDLGVAVGDGLELALKADELAAGVVALEQPIGINEPGRVVVRRRENGLDEVSLRVLDLPTLVEMKTKAGRPKDRVALPILIATIEERQKEAR